MASPRLFKQLCVPVRPAGRRRQLEPTFPAAFQDFVATLGPERPAKSRKSGAPSVRGRRRGWGKQQPLPRPPSRDRNARRPTRTGERTASSPASSAAEVESAVDSDIRRTLDAANEEGKQLRRKVSDLRREVAEVRRLAERATESRAAAEEELSRTARALAEAADGAVPVAEHCRVRDLLRGTEREVHALRRAAESSRAALDELRRRSDGEIAVLRQRLEHEHRVGVATAVTARGDKAVQTAPVLGDGAELAVLVEAEAAGRALLSSAAAEIGASASRSAAGVMRRLEEGRGAAAQLLRGELRGVEDCNLILREQLAVLESKMRTADLLGQERQQALAETERRLQRQSDELSAAQSAMRARDAACTDLMRQLSESRHRERQKGAAGAKLRMELHAAAAEKHRALSEVEFLKERIRQQQEQDQELGKKLAALEEADAAKAALIAAKDGQMAELRQMTAGRAKDVELVRDLRARHTLSQDERDVRLRLSHEAGAALLAILRDERRQTQYLHEACLRNQQRQELRNLVQAQQQQIQQLTDRFDSMRHRDESDARRGEHLDRVLSLLTGLVGSAGEPVAAVSGSLAALPPHAVGGPDRYGAPVPGTGTSSSEASSSPLKRAEGLPAGDKWDGSDDPGDSASARQSPLASYRRPQPQAEEPAGTGQSPCGWRTQLTERSLAELARQSSSNARTTQRFNRVATESGARHPRTHAPAPLQGAVLRADALLSPAVGAASSPGDSAAVSHDDGEWFRGDASTAQHRTPAASGAPEATDGQDAAAVAAPPLVADRTTRASLVPLPPDS